MLEKHVLKHTLLRLSKFGCTMFRQNVGQAWAGSKVVRLPLGCIYIENPQPVTMGLTKGSSDLIGWTPIDVTDEMVGSTVAIFTAVEVKHSDGGRTSKEQKRFIQNVKSGGGIAGVVRSADEAWELLRRARDTIQSGS